MKETLQMSYDPLLHHRRSIRLPHFDYSSAGYYFVTICTDQRNEIFGEVSLEVVHLTKMGNIVLNELKALESRFANVRLDEFIIMPNHVHAIIQLKEHPRPAPLNTIVGTFKSVTTYEAKALLGKTFRLWQRNYFEHIVRSDQTLVKIREYVANNPINWHLDELNPSSFE